MKVLVLTGSPHSNGTTALLADEFCMGAEEAGHQVVRVDTAKLDIHPCLGCLYCKNNNGKCVYDDDMSQIYPDLLAAEAVVLVTPLYYFGMTAQLKHTIDRFFSVNSALRETPKQFLLLAACGDIDDWAMDALTLHFKTICRYLHWKESGMVLAFGAHDRKDLDNTDYPSRAKQLGAKLKKH